VRVLIEFLPPCVQHGRDADRGAQMLRVGGDDGECIGRDFEQQPIHFGFVLVGDGADSCRKGEYDMEVRDRQQFRLPRFEPFLSSRPLTLVAVAIATGVVGDAHVRAILAALDMTAERSRPANLDRRHDAPLGKADVGGIGRAPRLAVAAEDVRHLQLWLGRRRCIRRAPPAPCSRVPAGSEFSGWC
jgi:hypothetical protein